MGNFFLQKLPRLKKLVILKCWSVSPLPTTAVAIKQAMKHQPNRPICQCYSLAPHLWNFYSFFSDTFFMSMTLYVTGKIVWHYISLQVWHYMSLQNFVWHSASLHQFLRKSGVWHKSVWHKNIDLILHLLYAWPVQFGKFLYTLSPFSFTLFFGGLCCHEQDHSTIQNSRYTFKRQCDFSATLQKQ